jgi:hypothetical protein
VSDKIEGNITLEQIKREYEEAIRIFPALHKYKDTHNIANLQKLCVEVSDFIKAIYSSTQNEQEREILRKHLDRLKNI